MCGIAGILRLTPPGETARAALERTPFDAIPEVWLDRLDESIRHRGPDGQGRFRDRAVRADGTVVDVALVHRRLSIIDHGGGAQPMVSQVLASGGNAGEGIGFRPLAFHGTPDATVHYQPLPDVRDTLAVVFNGCIYNHRELRRELEGAGRRFETDHSDTEVLLHGWREWGAGLADHLEGMYAAAGWDRGRGTLQLTRDLAFEKPLYFFQRDGLLAFASTAAGLTSMYAAVYGLPQVSSMDWLGDWIRFGFSDDPASVAIDWPARAMVHDADKWGEGSGVIDFSPLPERDGSRRVTVDSAERMLRESVRERLEADVPLGCFLSGGVDSSLIASFAKQELGRLRTFSVRMPDPAYDESGYAEQVAAHLGTDHTTLNCQANPAEDLVTLIRQSGQPFGDSSLLPTYWVSRATRQEVKVALTGDGGDELFCGYERYRAAKWLPLAAKFGGSIDTESISDTSPKARLSKLRRLLVASRYGYQELLAIYQKPDLHKLIDPAELGPWHEFGVREPDPAGIDFWWYLSYDLMRKVDGAAMSVALETRAPFLSRPLIRHCLAAPMGDLMPGGQRKGLLRAVARRHLPAHIVDRPKMGFAIPIGEWFRSDYGGMRTLLLDHMNSAEPFGPPSLGIDLNMAYVRQMLDEHLGTGKSGLVTRDHSQRLYMLLVLSIWARWLGSLRT